MKYIYTASPLEGKHRDHDHHWDDLHHHWDHRQHCQHDDDDKNPEDIVAISSAHRRDHLQHCDHHHYCLPNQVAEYKALHRCATGPGFFFLIFWSGWDVSFIIFFVNADNFFENVVESFVQEQVTQMIAMNMLNACWEYIDNWKLAIYWSIVSFLGHQLNPSD